MKKIEEVNEKKWPRDVRKALNELIRRRNRASVIKLGGQGEPKWLQADDIELGDKLGTGGGGGSGTVTLDYFVNGAINAITVVIP